MVTFSALRAGSIYPLEIFLVLISVTRVGTLIVATIIYNRYKIDTCFEVLLSFNVVTSIVYNPLPANVEVVGYL